VHGKCGFEVWALVRACGGLAAHHLYSCLACELLI
jgi:hypothetical protein